MTTKKRPVKQNPLLTAVARKLGHAAGKLTKATHELTENISALPGAVSEKLHGAVNARTAKKTARTSGRQSKKKAGSASRSRTAKPLSDSTTSPKKNSPQRKIKSRTRTGK